MAYLLSFIHHMGIWRYMFANYCDPEVSHPALTDTWPVIFSNWLRPALPALPLLSDSEQGWSKMELVPRIPPSLKERQWNYISAWKWKNSFLNLFAVEKQRDIALIFRINHGVQYLWQSVVFVGELRTFHRLHCVYVQCLHDKRNSCCESPSTTADGKDSAASNSDE